MNSQVVENPQERIGSVAGDVWHFLDERGPVTMTVLAREVGAPRDMILMALGWLSREGKVQFYQQARKRLIHLADR